jgi:hypothetical protein
MPNAGCAKHKRAWNHYAASIVPCPSDLSRVFFSFSYFHFLVLASQIYPLHMNTAVLTSANGREKGAGSRCVVTITTTTNRGASRDPLGSPGPLPAKCVHCGPVPAFHVKIASADSFHLLTPYYFVLRRFRCVLETLLAPGTALVLRAPEGIIMLSPRLPCLFPSHTFLPGISGFLDQDRCLFLRPSLGSCV